SAPCCSPSGFSLRRFADVPDFGLRAPSIDSRVMPTRVLLADDHAMVRQGLRLLLQREGLDVVGEAADGQEAVRLATESCPDVAVLELVASGKTTKEIAGLLGISVKTAESHRTHILRKLEAPNTAGIVRYAIRQGLIQD